MNSKRLLPTILAVFSTASAYGQPVEYKILAVSDQQAIGLGTGINYNGLDAPFIDESGRVTFRSYFSSVTSYLHRIPDSEPPLILRAGDSPVGLGPNARIGTTLWAEDISRDGDILIFSQINFIDSIPAPTLYGYGTYTDAQSGFGVSGLGGGTAPGSGALFCILNHYTVRKSLSTAGHFALYTSLCGPNVHGRNGAGIWVTDENGQNIRLVILSNNPDPNNPSEWISVTGDINVNSSGTVVFGGNYSRGSVTPENNSAVFAWNESTGLSTIVREGDPVPGFPPTVTFLGSPNARINDLGHTLIWGLIQGPGITDDANQILISDRGGNGFEHVYREGIQAPGLTPGVKISRIKNVYFNNRSQIGFFSDVVGPTMPFEDETYFWADDGSQGLNPVARTGQNVPGYTNEYTLDDFWYTDFGAPPNPEDPVFTDQGRLLFVGQLTYPSALPGSLPRVHFMSDEVNELRLIAPQGAQLNVSNDPNNPELRTISRSSFRLRGSTNDAEQVALLVRFTDDTSAIVLASYADGCLADVNGDGQATPTDFTAWLSAFNANAPECDQNGDGQCTPTDFSAWISNYTIGC